MYIKFRNSEEVYNVSVSVPVWRSVVRLEGSELPTESSDFDLYNDEDIIIDYFEGFNTVYDSGEGFIEFTNDCSIYSNYLNYDENNYVISTFTTNNQDYECEGYLYQKGTGKQYKLFDMELFNENGFPLYKIKNNKLTKTTKTELEAFRKEHETKRLAEIKESKIKELSNICNQMIETGVTINEEQFSYTLTDQNNISAAVLLSQQTGMSVPYHSNGNTCRLMSLKELMTVYVYQQMNLMHHQTYYNQLKLYVQNELTDIESVSNVTYGDELTGIYLDTYNAMMEQSKNLASAYTTQVEIE